MSVTSLPDGWRWAMLGELGHWQGGGTPSKSNPAYWENGHIPWVSPKDMKVFEISSSEDSITASAVSGSSAKLLPAGAVLVVTRSGILERTLPIAVTRVPVTVNQDLKALTPANGIESKFVAYGLQCFDQAIRQASAKDGTTVASIDLPRFLRFPFPLPPTIAEQRRIVEAIETQLTRLDAAVAALKRAQANLKRYRASVLKAAVEGRLVPTEAELARREGRDFESGDEFLAQIQELRQQQVTTKRVPQLPQDHSLVVPQGWAVGTVDQLSTKVSDGVHKKPSYVDEGIPFVTVKNLTAGPGIDFSDLQYVTHEDHLEFVKRTNPEPDDILISKDGTLGVVRLVPPSEPFSIFVSVALVKPVDRRMSRYLSIALQSLPVQGQMVPKGSGLQHIHLEDLRQDCIPLPPIDEAERIVAEVETRLEEVEFQQRTISVGLSRAARLRQSILHQAFSGQLELVS